MAEFVSVRITPAAVEAATVRTSGGGVDADNITRIPYTDDEGLLTALEELAQKFGELSAAWCVGLPSEEFSFRRITFPFNKPKAIQSALRFELEGLLPYPPDSLETAALPLHTAETGETEVLACAAEKEVLQKYRDLLARAGIAARFLVPDVSGLLAFYHRYLDAENGILFEAADDRLTALYAGKNGNVDFLVGLPDDRELTLFAAGGEEEPERWFATGRQAGRLVTSHKDTGGWKEELKETVITAGPVEEQVSLIGLALLGEGRFEEGLNFSKERGFSFKFASGFKLQAVGAVAALLLWTAYGYYHNHHLQTEIDNARREMVQVYKQAVPGGRAVKPEVQLRQKVEALEGAASVGGGDSGLLGLMQQLSVSLPVKDGVMADEIHYDQRGVTLTLRAPGQERVDAAMQALQSLSGYAGADLLESTQPAGQDYYRFKARLKK